VNRETSSGLQPKPAQEESATDIVRRVYAHFEAVTADRTPPPGGGVPSFRDLVLVQEVYSAFDRLDKAGIGTLTWLLTQEPELRVRTARRSRAISAAQLLAHEPEPVSWLWDGLLPAEGLAMLSAAPKVGKSTLAYALAVAIAQGHPFLDYETMKSPVLIVALEEGRSSVIRRLQRFGLRPEDPLYVLEAPFDLDEIRLAISDYDIRLVIMDTLARYWVGRVTDENNNAQVAAALAPLLDLVRTQRPLCVLLIHHDRKSGGSPGESVRGAGDLFAAQEQLLQLVTVPNADKNHRILHVTGRYQEESPPEVRLALDATGYRRLDTPGDSGQAVWDALPRDGGLTERELIASTNLKRNQVTKGIKELGVKVREIGSGTKVDPRRFWRADAPSLPDKADSVVAAPKDRTRQHHVEQILHLKG
jgi:hypothetical protein